MILFQEWFQIIRFVSLELLFFNNKHKTYGPTKWNDDKMMKKQ